MTSRAARWRRSLCWAARARGSAHRHHPWPLPRRAWESSRSRLAQAGVDGWRGGWMEGWMDGGVDGWVDGWMGVLVTRAALCTHHITTPDLSIHPSIHPPIHPSIYPSMSVYLYTVPGATRKKRCRIAVARYLPLAMLPPPALRMSGRSASQLTPRYGLHCRRRPRALELQTRLEPHAWALGAAGSAEWAEAAAFAFACHWALGGTAAPPECGAPPPRAKPCQPEEAGAAASCGAPENLPGDFREASERLPRGFREGASQQCGACLLAECLVLNLPSLGVTADLVST